MVVSCGAELHVLSCSDRVMTMGLVRDPYWNLTVGSRTSYHYILAKMTSPCVGNTTRVSKKCFQTFFSSLFSPSRRLHFLCGGLPGSDGEAADHILPHRAGEAEEMVSAQTADRLPGKAQQASGHLLLILGGSLSGSRSTLSWHPLSSYTPFFLLPTASCL